MIFEFIFAIIAPNTYEEWRFSKNQLEITLDDNKRLRAELSRKNRNQADALIYVNKCKSRRIGAAKLKEVLDRE